MLVSPNKKNKARESEIFERLFDILDRGVRERHTKKVVLCKDLRMLNMYIYWEEHSGKGNCKGKGSDREIHLAISRMPV